MDHFDSENIKDLKESEQEERSWIARNWPYLILGGCFGTGFLCVACIVILAAIGIYSINSSTIYAEGLSRAQNDPRVQAELGTPIEAGLLPSGSIDTNNSYTTADLEIPISGPNGSGTVFVEAESVGDNWDFFVLTVQTDSELIIDLLEQ